MLTGSGGDAMLLPLLCLLPLRVLETIFLQAFYAVLASTCHLVRARFLDRTCHVMVHITSFCCLPSNIVANDL
jgi:hypothetical protein